MNTAGRCSLSRIPTRWCWERCWPNARRGSCQFRPIDCAIYAIIIVSKSAKMPASSIERPLNGPDPGPFAPAQAFKSPAVRRILDQLQALIIDLPDKNAEFVEITVKYMDKDQVKDIARVHGWLLEKDANSFTIYSPYGHREICENNEKTQIWQSEKTEGGSRSWKIDVTTSVMMTPHPIADYVKQISEIRAKGNNEYQLSSGGGLTGQFQGSGASLKEAILAAWLDRASKADLAAAILLPALDTLYEDQNIVDMTRVQLGDILGYRMLMTFVGDRDYQNVPGRWRARLPTTIPTHDSSSMQKSFPRSCRCGWTISRLSSCRHRKNGRG